MICSKVGHKHTYAIRPFAMDLLNVDSTPKKVCNDVVENDVEVRDDENFQLVEVCTQRDAWRVRNGYDWRVQATARQGA
jgi:hypothetical protein